MKPLILHSLAVKVKRLFHKIKWIRSDLEQFKSHDASLKYNGVGGEWCIWLGEPDSNQAKALFEPSDFVNLLPLETKLPSLISWCGVCCSGVDHKWVCLFESANQARKNGWDKPIPNGWSEWRFKKTHRLFIFKNGVK